MPRRVPLRGRRIHPQGHWTSDNNPSSVTSGIYVHAEIYQIFGWRSLASSFKVCAKVTGVGLQRA